MYDVKAVTYKRTCGRCGGPAVVTGTIGPSRICDQCADKLLGFIWGPAWPAMRKHLADHGKVTPAGFRPAVPSR
jgi:hypothetical protein